MLNKIESVEELGWERVIPRRRQSAQSRGVEPRTERLFAEGGGHVIQTMSAMESAM